MDVALLIKDAIKNNVESLDLSNKEITKLPPEIGGFRGKSLDLSGNKLTTLPTEIGACTNLTGLYLRGNEGIALPPEIGNLAGLEWLDLSDTELAELPPGIGRLNNLEHLYLNGNQLTALLPEIGLLSNLMELDLSDNQLTTLPPEIGNLPETAHIDLMGNPFTDLSPTLTAQGSEAILAYFRASARHGARQWISKLLVVGQGGVGKTCLLRALRGQEFASQDTTHQIEVGALELPHPSEPDVTMRLNTWDFGGQEIYHATHQFFLTNRSLFVLVWNGRQEWQLSNLYYWLDTIKALAPDSPVLLVATWTEKNDARLPLEEIGRKYPTVAGNWSVSNTLGTGMEELRAAIADAAAGLPLMGEMWPAEWLSAAEAIRDLPAGHIFPKELKRVMREHGVKKEECDILARWLHELGDILYFQDNPDLDDIVLLNSTWVTNNIFRVLGSEEVERGKGVFSKAHMDDLWPELDEGMQDHLLRLMEQFDLSYRTLEDKDVSLVVERLPLDVPDYEALWEAHKRNGGCKEIAIRYKLNTIPAGIPTWFIAREHRFTTNTHWRGGAVFAQELEAWARIALGHAGSERYEDALSAAHAGHLALVQADTQKMWVKLTVRGPLPANFFALLKDGMELLLQRFKDLEVKRLVPCPGHDGQPCDYEWDLVNLERAIQLNKMEVECGSTFQPVPVTGLLYGVHGQTTLDVLLKGQARIEGKQDAIIHKLDDLILKQREFTSQFRGIQEQVDLRCPNVFILHRPDHSGGIWDKLRRAITGDDLVLHLCCQQPGEWHPVLEGGRYSIYEPAKWLKTMAPYVRGLVQVMQYTAPFIGPVAGIMDKETADLFKEHIKLMEELIKKLPDIQDDAGLEQAKGLRESHDPIQAHGAQLRGLRKLLESLDSNKEWGGLDRVVTKEGHNLWLCEHHKAAYLRD